MSVLLATILLATPALSNPPAAPLPAGPVSLDAFKGWVAVPVAVMVNGQVFTQWMLVPAQAVAGAMSHAGAQAATLAAAATANLPTNPAAPAMAAANSGATHGRVIAATCAACHGTHGKSETAIPALAGTDKAYFIKQMNDFKTGKREATVMHQHAKAYTDEEIRHMAEFFAAAKP
jgi:cytochrome c553